MTAPILCLCGARIARGYRGRLVHVTTPNGAPHYAIEAKPTSRREGVPPPSRRAAGRSGISSGGH